MSNFAKITAFDGSETERIEKLSAIEPETKAKITSEFMAAVSKEKKKAYVYSKADDLLFKAAGNTFDEVIIFSSINELNAENAVVILPSEKFNDIMTSVKDCVIITYGCKTGKKSSYTDVFEKNNISWYNLFGFPYHLLVSSLTKEVIAGVQRNVYEIRPLKGTSLSITDKNGNGAPAGTEGMIAQTADDETFRTFFKGVILSSGKTYFTGFDDNYFYADGKYYNTDEVTKVLSSDAEVNDCAGINEDIYIVSGNGKDAQYFLDRIHELGIPVNCILIDRIPRENGTVVKDELEKILKNSNASKAVSINEELYNGICEVWKSVLNTESVEPYEDFFEAGGNSILVSKLMFEMLKKFSITIPFHYILENSNVMGLYNFIVNNGKVSEEQEQAKLEKLRKEMDSCLDLDFSVKERIAQCSGKGDTKNLLLTGATGFLGIFILKTLVEETDKNICLLVRASNEAAAKRRIIMNLKKYKLSEELLSDRISYAAGDTEKEYLGLSHEKYDELAENTGIVLHAASLVNFVTPYEQMKGPNVEGTKNMLKFCTYKKEKEFHFVSSYGIYEAMLHSAGQYTTENTPLRLEYANINAYTFSKFISDKMTDMAVNDGLTAKIYRSGTVSGDTVNGICQENDFFWRLVYAGVKVKEFPVLKNIGYNLIPADVMGKAIVRLMLEPFEKEKHRYNLAYKKTYTAEFVSWIRKLDPEVKDVQFRKWYKDAVDYAKDSEDRTLLSIMAVFPKAEVVEGFEELDMDYKFTEEMLDKVGANYKMNYDDFEKTFRFFMNALD